MTPDEMVHKVAAELSIKPRDAYRRMRWGGWGVAQFETELETADWKERFEASWTGNRDRVVQDAIGRLLRNGPQKLAVLSPEQLRVLVHDQKLSLLAEQYQPLEHGGRLLLAPTGFGKTTACVATLRRLMAEAAIEYGRSWEGGYDYEQFKNLPARFMWVRSFDIPNARLEHQFGRGEAELIERASGALILFLDDLGWESKRGGADDAVMEVLATRYDRGLVTVATSGLKYGQLVERYGEAVVRRIVESDGLPGRVLDLWPKDQTHV